MPGMSACEGGKENRFALILLLQKILNCFALLFQASVRGKYVCGVQLQRESMLPGVENVLSAFCAINFEWKIRKRKERRMFYKRICHILELRSLS
jgi:hypothetical protein